MVNTVDAVDAVATYAMAHNNIVGVLPGGDGVKYSEKVKT